MTKPMPRDDRRQGRDGRHAADDGPPAAPGRRVRLVRDRPTWLIYLALCVFGTYLYGLSAALPLLRAEQGLSQTVAGLHGTAMACGGLLAGTVLSYLTRRPGRRAVIWLGLAGVSAGSALVAVGGALPVTLFGYGLAGACGSFTLFVAMAVLGDHHGPAGPGAISEANAVVVTVGIGTSYLVSAVAGTALGWRAALFTPVLLTVLLALTMGRVQVAPAPAPGTAPAAGGPRGGAARPPYGWRFHLTGVILACCVAVEFCFTLWAAELLADRTGLGVARAATGLTAFTAGMAAGRFGGARLALRFSPAPLLTGALLLTLAGWVLFWTAVRPVPAYAGLLVCGLGVALHFPLGMSRLIAVSGDRADQASAAAAVWGGVAAAGGPFLLGALGDGYGTHTAFLLVPVLLAAAVAGVAVTSRR